MELWIRSQDIRMLTPIKESITQYCNCVFYKGCILGDYKDEKRALEVLDEINDMLQGKFAEDCGKKYTGKTTLSKFTNCMVYQMPQE